MNPLTGPEPVRAKDESDRESEEDGQSEELRVRVRKTEAVPSDREVDEHNVDHATFRAWCPHCVKGRGEAYGHPRGQGPTKEIPVISIDYMYVHPEQADDEEREKGMPILVARDSRTKMVYARVVPQKGHDDYAIGALKRIVEQLGYKRIVMKSDNEPAILLLKDLVRKETDVEIVMEEAPVGDHQANGAAENAVKNIQGQFRALKDALETRLGGRIQGDHVAVPWLIMHASSVICRRRVDKEGFTPYRRWRGRPFNRPVAEFGENIWYLPANSAGKNKFEARWHEGVWLGVRLESGEAIIGTSEGVLKARDFRRKPENGGRWSRADFDKFIGVPWELYPGIKGSTEMRSKVRLPQEPAEVTRPIRGKDEYVPRRFRIQKSDLQKFGYTAGCPGCRAANRGLTAMGHSEECRRRIQEELERVGDARIERENARANAYFGEMLEESEKKRQKKPEGEEGDPEQHREAEGCGQQRRGGERGKHLEEAQPEKKARRREEGGSSSSSGPQGEATASSEGKQDDVNMEIKGQKRGDEDAWEELAKRLRRGARERPEESETKTEMDVTGIVEEINAVLEGTLNHENVAIQSLQDVMAEFEVEEVDWNGNNFEGDEQLTDGRTGEQLDPGKVQEARAEELRELERRVYVEVDEKECWDKTGKPPIGVRWVDVRKGDGSYRSRLVAKDYRPKSRAGDVEGLFASMPPLELVKLVIAMAAEECRRGRTHKVMLIDIGKAHLYAPIEGEVYVELAPERHRQGRCAKLLYTLYGMRTAASSWEKEYTKTLVEAGFLVGRASSCTFYHPGREIRIVVHGDDFVVTGSSRELEFVRKILSEKYPVKVRSIMGPGPGDEKEATILNRTIRWEGGEVSFEADPKHVEKMLQDMRLSDCKPNLTPGVKEDRKDGEEALKGEQIKIYRSVVARANYLSQDRPDIRYATKELCRHMQTPRAADWSDLKRMCRYLKGRPRLIQDRMRQDPQPGVIEVLVDADWAGCPKTRRSTSGGAMIAHGMCLRTWSTTQRVVARSSGEAELYAAVRGAAEGLGLKSMARDLGWNWSVRLWTDSSACKGTCNRSGLGRLKHLDVESLWLQEAVKDKTIELCKIAGATNMADLMTKHLPRAMLDRHAANLGLRDA